MTVRQAAVSAARILQADDAEALLADGEKTDEEIMLDEDVKALATAVNLAAAEMSGDGFPIIRRVDAESVGGRIPLADLPDLVGVTAADCPCGSRWERRISRSRTAAGIPSSIPRSRRKKRCRTR